MSSSTCTCHLCAEYQKQFGPDVHPCPNYKKRKLPSKKKVKKTSSPKKVITSRWSVPPTESSSSTKFPPCRCLKPSSPPQPSHEDSPAESFGVEIFSPVTTNAERGDSRPNSGADGNDERTKRSPRAEFYAALEKQDEKTSADNVKAPSAISSASLPSQGSKSSSPSDAPTKGVIKPSRSSEIRNNSAKIFLKAEERNQLMKACAAASANAQDDQNSQQEQSDPLLTPSRQFMNICAQELAKRKLIARAKAAQDLSDSTDLFGMESTQILTLEKNIHGCTWRIRMFQPQS